MRTTKAAQDERLHDHDRRLGAIDRNPRPAMETARVAWEESSTTEAFAPNELEHFVRGHMPRAIKAPADRPACRSPTRRTTSGGAGADVATIVFPLPARDFDTTEVSVPWKLLLEAGHDVVFATEAGATPACDPLLAHR